MSNEQAFVLAFTLIFVIIGFLVTLRAGKPNHWRIVLGVLGWAVALYVLGIAFTGPKMPNDTGTHADWLIIGAVMSLGAGPVVYAVLCYYAGRLPGVVLRRAEDGEEER